MAKTDRSERADRVALQVYESLSNLLSPPNAYPSGRYRSTSDIADGLKRIRRTILTEGIPEIVSASETKGLDEGSCV